MTAPDNPASSTHPLGIDSEKPLRVDLHVRPDISTISHRQVDAIQHRLRTLSKTGAVADIERTEWPPATLTDGRSTSDERTRERIVAEFETWAEEYGISLRPAFRRQPVPASLTDSGDSEEKIRVPIVTLALYEGSELTGVVPHTTDYGTDAAETITVDDWLCAVEEATDGMATQSALKSDEQDSTA